MPVENPPGEAPPAPEVWEGDMEGFAEFYGMTNWAWAISDRQSETPTDTVVAVEYASPDALDELTLAVGPPGIIPVEYAGEKQGTGEFYWPLYSPTFQVVTGPSWKAPPGLFPAAVIDYIMLPESCGDKVLSLTYPSITANYDGDEDNGFETDYYNYGRPPAEAADIAIMEAQRNGRKVLHSEQLAIASDGGRISLFQYATTDFGLVVLAYINNEKVVSAEFVTMAYDGSASWASELPPETFLYVEVTMLYESGAGLVIGFARYGPEWDARHLLAEKDGRFVGFNYGNWAYDVWQDPQAYVQDNNGLINSEAWPDLDPARLAGDWAGKYHLSFNPDGTGTRDGSPLTYSIEGNMLITEQGPEKQLYRAKLEGGLLYMNDIFYCYDSPAYCTVLRKR